MQLAVKFLFLMGINSFIMAQDTLQYKNYIDYERNDHIARVKSTILTKTGDFLSDGNYCFKGNTEDFDLLLKTSQTTMRKKLNINNDDIFYLSGKIKDSIKVGDWYLKVRDRPIIKEFSNTVDSIRVGSYNYVRSNYIADIRYFFYENMTCYTTEITGSLNCIDSRGHSFYYSPSPNGYRTYRTNFCGDYKYEINIFNRNDTITTHFRIDMEEYIPSKYTMERGAHLRDYIQITTVEVIKDNKLIKFSITREEDIKSDKFQKMTTYDFYPEFRYHLSKCWELK